MSYDHYESRSDRFEKRRKNTKMTNTLIVIAVLLSAFLFGMFVFGGGDDEEEQVQNEETSDSGLEEENTEEQENEENEETNDEDSTEEQESSEDETESEENSEDETEEERTAGDGEEVKEVINGNWEPYPTEQEEPHSINLSQGSQDRIEVEQAIAQAVQSSTDNLTYWWLESGGVPDQVVGYVEDKTNGEYYRVPLKWIENEGWQPQKIEVLYENLGEQKLNEANN